MSLVIFAKTSAGSIQEHSLPATITAHAHLFARMIVEREHLALLHHINSDGSVRSDQTFAGFVRGCVPQSEARALLERAADCPQPIIDVIKRGGIDSMLLLYSLTLPLAKSRKRLGGGVWIQEES